MQSMVTGDIRSAAILRYASHAQEGSAATLDSGWVGQRQRLRSGTLRAKGSASATTDGGGARAKDASAQAKHREAALPMSPSALADLSPRIDIQDAFDRLLNEYIDAPVGNGSPRKRKHLIASGTAFRVRLRPRW